MTTDSVPLTTSPAVAAVGAASKKAHKKLSSPWASFFAVVLAVLWTIPTFGLALTSIRPERQIKTSGWWTFFTSPDVTLDNYKQVLGSESGINLGAYFVNSFVIVVLR